MRSNTLILLFILMTTGVLTGCKDKVTPGVREVKREQVTGVTLEVMKPAEVAEYYETSGTVRAKTISTVASRTMGTVTSVKVKEGDRVGSGQLLLTLDDSDVVQRVKAAEEALEGAKQQQYLSDITYQRYKKLYDEKALAGQELDQIETQKKIADSEYERAKAMLAEARVSHSFAKIISPSSGIITEKKIETGSMAVPGMPLLAVEDNSAYRIEVNVDEKMSGRVKAGMEVSVFIEALNRELSGKVTEVVPSIDPMSRSFLVKIALRGEDLKNGYYARVSIPVGKKEALLVSKKAVVEKGQLTGVYAVDRNSVITYRLVRAGKLYGDKVEILSGLNPGDTVVVDGVEKTVDGGIVKQQSSARK
ncbi:MAG: efflux RND transporter periplasmic adaptor subunit [Nitrospiraceae bacterium]|nr:MAG: efflux RND transporter periplasmic adaptor subunit [Nitrospiraceae bacterium]